MSRAEFRLNAAVWWEIVEHRNIPNRTVLRVFIEGALWDPLQTPGTPGELWHPLEILLKAW